MITVPEGARRTGLNPETIRRWIRAGRLHSERAGTTHLIDERELDDLAGTAPPLGPPGGWGRFADGTPQPDWTALVRRSRDRH